MKFPRRVPVRTLVVVASLLVLGPALTASAQTTQRPIQDWLSPNIGAGDIYWFNSADLAAGLIFFDYFGKYNALYSLHEATEITGTVTERTLKNGRAAVHVVMHTTNAVTWADSEGFAALIFGHFPAQIKAGADAALGDTLLTVDFENSAPGAPLPSLFALSFVPSANYTLDKLALVGNATGTLRAAFGLPDGTPAKAHTTQRGLYDVPGMQVNGHDVFPAETLDIHPIK